MHIIIIFAKVVHRVLVCVFVCYTFPTVTKGRHAC